MPLLTANGITIYYEEKGSGEPLVCISGLGAAHDSWTLAREALARQYRVITFDNRGMGQTSAPKEPYSIEQMARDTAALMEALGLASAHIAGQSMGSSIAQFMAVRHPQKVRKLLLCNPFKRIREIALFVFRTNARLLREGVPTPLVFEVILPWLFSNAFFQDQARVRAMIELASAQPQQSREAFERQIEAAAAFDSGHLLKDIGAPTLLVAGSHDIMTPADEAQDMAKIIPNARFEAMPTGHLSIIESPEAFAKLAARFLLE